MQIARLCQRVARENHSKRINGWLSFVQGIVPDDAHEHDREGHDLSRAD